MAITRRYVVYGQMPLRRTPQSGLFTTRFKEDAFFIDFDEQNMLLKEGARTEQSIELPLYFIDNAYYERKKQVETLGLAGSAGRVEVYMQYAKLPLLDPQHLDLLRTDILQKVKAARETFLDHQNSQALFQMLKLAMCDEPITFFDYDRANYSLRLKARAPLPAPLPVSVQTKRGRINYFRQYEDLLCSKAVGYALSAFEALPFLQEFVVTLVRMEAQPVEGLLLVDEKERQKKVWQLRREALPAETETPEQRRKREAAEKNLLKQQQKEEEKRKKELSQQKRQLEMTTRAPDNFDELFDGSLPYESVLLSARVSRQGFMDLSKSKMSYSARRALEMFELRLKTDEETTYLAPVESFLEIVPTVPDLSN